MAETAVLHAAAVKVFILSGAQRKGGFVVFKAHGLQAFHYFFVHFLVGYGH